MAFPCSLSDVKSSEIFRTLLSILADLNNAVVLMVSSCSLISKSFASFTNPLRTFSSAPFKIGIVIPFVFHSVFFLFSSKVKMFMSLFAFF